MKIFIYSNFCIILFSNNFLEIEIKGITLFNDRSGINATVIIKFFHLIQGCFTLIYYSLELHNRIYLVLRK